MKNVYLWKMEDKIMFHASLDSAIRLDGVSRWPDLTVTSEQFQEAGGLARVIGGRIVLGKTAEEKAEEERRAQIAVYKAELAELDREAGSGRAVREISLAVADKNGLSAGDAYENLKGIEAKAGEIRAGLEPLLK